MSQRADEVKVGVMVVVAALLLFVTVVAVSHYNPFRTQPHVYTARFTFVGGLSPGSTVRFGGLTVGRVEKIHILQENASEIEIEISVKPDTPVRRDSEAAVTSLGLLGDNYVEISLGTPQSPMLPSGERLKQKQYPGLPEIFAKVDVAVGDANKLIKDLNSQVNDIAEKAKKLLTDIDVTFGPGNQQKLTSILAESEKLIKDASPKVNATLEQIRSASAKIEPLITDINGTVKKVDKLIVDINDVVAENRPEIKKALQDLDKALADARTTILDVRSMLQYNRGNLDILIENLASSSDNIREFTDTVKQQPFSLIRMPSKKPRVPPETPKK